MSRFAFCVLLGAGSAGDFQELPETGVPLYWPVPVRGFYANGKPFGPEQMFPLQWAWPALSRAWPFPEFEERAQPRSEAVYESSPDGPYLF